MGNSNEKLNEVKEMGMKSIKTGVNHKDQLDGHTTDN